MGSEHRLNYNQGEQSIRTVAVSSLGTAVRPTAATFEIVDERYSDTDVNYSLVAAAAATIDAVSTTTTAACGRSSDAPSLLTLTSTASVAAGGRYLLTNPSGQSEIITAVSVQAGPKTVLSQHEPRYGYPSGSTFQGLEVSGAVPSAVCNDDATFDARLAVIWTFSGVTPARVRERLELVRPQPSWATAADLLKLEPGLASRNADLAVALAQAHFDLDLDLRSAGLNPYTFNPGPLGVGAVTYLAAYHALKDRDEEGARDRAVRHHKRYEELRLQLVVGKDKAGVTEVDKATGAAKGPDIRSLFSGI